jgi:hypothetical protein
MSTLQQQFGYVNIDGITTPLMTFATPSASLVYRSAQDPDRGKFNRGISVKDVVVNSRTPIPQFKTEDAHGASWAARYLDPLFGDWKYIFIKFDDSEVQIDSEESIESEASLDSNSEISGDDDISQYGSGEAEAEAGSDLDEHISRVVREEIGPTWIQVEIETDNVESDKNTLPDFERLPHKDRYLPLSFVLSLVDQWKIILKCLATSFVSVNDLPKVSDEVLAEAADFCIFAHQKRGNLSSAARALIDYAHQRNV